MPDKCQTKMSPAINLPCPECSGDRFIHLCFGGNQVGSKIALQQFPPMLCAALAFSLSSIALLVYAWFTDREFQVPDPIIWRLHIISAILFVLFNATALIGLQFTLASRASIFIAMHPLFVVVFNYFILNPIDISYVKLAVFEPMIVS